MSLATLEVDLENVFAACSACFRMEDLQFLPSRPLRRFVLSTFDSAALGEFQPFSSPGWPPC